MDSFYLAIDKPGAMSSRRVVDIVGRCVGTRKVGHAGTLDPLATGVLVTAIGRATRLVEYVQRMPKTYEAEFQLGATSDTDDIEGEVHVREDVVMPDEATIRKALEPFVGTIDQVPPAYSALKLEGRRAYDLARRGEEVVLNARPVTIHAITLLGLELPRLRLRIECGSGTYIRSLARDLGERLGTGGLMSALRRTAIGSFVAERAVTIDELSTGAWREKIEPLEKGVEHLPRLVIAPEKTWAFSQGQHVAQAESTLRAGQECAAFTSDDHFLGIAQMKQAPEGFACHLKKGGFLEVPRMDVP
ncbi:tRNA pseudouridine synthase B [Planctomycetes bacterium Pan216]|uniref:tRNA pseudouridine synthase B n=1 Tax=Kolteria novifilia TaxID=2527975 RepID=A0A518BC32_9BACT|nr:tRNA pseudouridine synthase B [Planctomycetes bacterium Pan216]